MDDKIKSKRGGKRTGAGRKKGYECDLVSVRIPETMKDTVIAMREHAKQGLQHHIIPIEAMIPETHLTEASAPLFLSSISAGFASPADDYIVQRLDLNKHFMKNPSATIFLRARGDSMNLAGILDNTILQVDKSRNEKNNDIVIASVDGDFTVKRYIKRNGQILLCPDSSNPIHKPIKIEPGRDISIWGVVCGTHHKFW